VVDALRERGILVGVISYNHIGNVRRILEAFGLLDRIDYIVAEWHSNKDQMLGHMLETARADGHRIEPSEAMLVDDDPYRIYRGQCERMGAAFRCFGMDISDLREVLDLLDPEDPPLEPEPAPRSA
jgi:predicted phosphatase